MPQPGNRKKVKQRAGAAVGSSGGGASSGVAVGKAKAKAKSKAKANRPSMSPEQLLQQAQVALAYDDFEGAKAALREALQQAPEHLEVLTAYGALLAEVGPQEEAVEVLRRAVALSPDDGFEKYMYLAQLLEGEQALQAASAGVDLLQRQVMRAHAAAAAAADSGGRRAAAVAGAAEQRLQRQLCGALCSLAEMRMAAAGEGEGVDEGTAAEVEGLLARAAAADGSSAEPGQALASLRYEQGRPEEALAALRDSMARWFKRRAGDDDEDEEGGESSSSDGDSEMASGSGSGDELVAPVKPTTLSEDPDTCWPGEGGGGGDSDDDDDDDDDGSPSFEFRFECAKLLLELDDGTDVAVQVLEDLIAEDDSDPHVWHMLALSYYSGGGLEEAAEVAAHGRKVLQAAMAGAADRGGSFEELVASFDDLEAAIADVQQQQAQQQQQEQQQQEQQQQQGEAATRGASAT